MHQNSRVCVHDVEILGSYIGGLGEIQSSDASAASGIPKMLLVETPEPKMIILCLISI
jgi:hypothetical protein